MIRYVFYIGLGKNGGAGRHIIAGL